MTSKLIANFLLYIWTIIYVIILRVISPGSAVAISPGIFKNGATLFRTWIKKILVPPGIIEIEIWKEKIIVHIKRSKFAIDFEVIWRLV